MSLFMCEGGDGDDDEGVSPPFRDVDCALIEAALVSGADLVRLQDVDLEDGQVLRFEVRVHM
jgi:hypothetical protein